MTSIMRTNSVLTDDVFRVQLLDGSIVRKTLPGLMASLVADEVLDLPGVRQHHSHLVHMFLSQLMSLVGENGDPVTEHDFREALLHLEPSTHAWQIIPERGEYAFLQPAFSAEISSAKSDLVDQFSPSPSDIDFIWFSNKHSLKREMQGQTEIDVWLWQLVATQSGACGNATGKYGSFRMNSGTSSRGYWAVYDRSWGMGMRICEDARMINEGLSQTSDLHGFAKKGGIALMWTIPWIENSNTSPPAMLRAQDLDIRVLEVTRRINLAVDGSGVIFAMRALTKNPRTALAKTGREAFKAGVCGDIWAPVLHDKNGEKTFTPNAGGLPYDQLARLACAIGRKDEVVYPAPASRRQVEDPVLIAVAIAAGQGKTEGLYRREITFGDGVNDNPFLDASTGETAQAMVLDAKAMIRAVRQAIAAYLNKPVKNVPETIDNRYSALTTQQIDDVFFENLGALHIKRDGATEEWIHTLYAIGQNTLEVLFESVPVSRMKRMKFITQAESAFYRSFWSTKEKQGFHQWKEAVLNLGKEKHHV